MPSETIGRPSEKSSRLSEEAVCISPAPTHPSRFQDFASDRITGHCALHGCCPKNRSEIAEKKVINGEEEGKLQK